MEMGVPNVMRMTFYLKITEVGEEILKIASNY